MKERTELTQKAYLGMMVPFMLSTVTQPLLGAVDTAVIGMVGDAAAIAGVSLGANLFNTLYWLFGFLRVTTTGQSARIQGQGTGEARTRSFFLPLIFSLLIGSGFLMIQFPVLNGYLWLTRADVQVQVYVRQYYRILIWGAPFVLSNYVMLGWLMGQARVKESLFMQVGGNLINMCLDYWLVIRLGYGMQGVAAATLAAQVCSCGCGSLLMMKYGAFGRIKKDHLWSRSQILILIRQNRDLMLRTVCLLIHNNIFAMMGARMGTGILAANSILLQITSIQAYLFEGIANSSSVFAGRASGKNSPQMLREIMQKTVFWSFLLAALITVVQFLAGHSLLSIFTHMEDLLLLAGRYQVYCYCYPFIAAVGLTYYGIYTGTGLTGPVLLSTLLALAAFIPVCVVGSKLIGNDGLWLAYLTFYGGRSAGLFYYRTGLSGQMAVKA